MEAMTKQQNIAWAAVVIVLIGILIFYGNRNENPTPAVEETINSEEVATSSKDVADDENDNEEEVGDSEVNQVFPIDIRNVRYSIDERSVTLVNGQSLMPAAPGSETVMKVSLLQGPAFADIDGDGVKDGAVVLRDEPGGTSIFYRLAVVLSNNGTTTTSNSVLLGDRIRIRSIEILPTQKMIAVTTLERKITDPMTALPSVEVNRNFMIESLTLTEIK